MLPRSSWPRIAGAYALQLRARKAKIIPWPWTVAVSILAASHGSPPLLPTLLAVVSMLFIATGVYTYNDIADKEMDKLNPKKLDQPLPSGKVSVKEALVITCLSGSVGLLLSLFVNFETFLLCVAFTALFLAYSNSHTRLKKRFLFKEGTLAMGSVLCSLIGGMTVGSISWIVIFWAVFLFAWVFTGSPIIDRADAKEDKIYGCKTLAMVLSWKRAIEIVIYFLLAVMTLTPLTYVQMGFNVLFPILMVIACLFFLRVVFPLRSNYDETVVSHIFKYLYGFFMLSQVALVVGSL